MPKQYRLRIRGSQREDIDEDLLAQALLMVAEVLQGQQQKEPDEPAEPSDEDGR